MDLPRAARPVVLALVVAAGVAGCGDDGPRSAEIAPPASTTAPPNVPHTTAAGAPTTAAGSLLRYAFQGGAVTGEARQQVRRGDTVRLQITSDVAEEVHVHGYDQRVTVPAGGASDLTFVANIPGVFEVELEGRHRRLFTLEVR